MWRSLVSKNLEPCCGKDDPDSKRLVTSWGGYEAALCLKWLNKLRLGLWLPMHQLHVCKQQWGNHGTSSKICKHMQPNISIIQYCTSYNSVQCITIQPWRIWAFGPSGRNSVLVARWQGVITLPTGKTDSVGRIPLSHLVWNEVDQGRLKMWNVRWPLRLVWFHVVWIYLRDCSEIDLFHSFFTWILKTKWMIPSVKPESPIPKQALLYINLSRAQIKGWHVAMFVEVRDFCKYPCPLPRLTKSSETRVNANVFDTSMVLDV